MKFTYTDSVARAYTGLADGNHTLFAQPGETYDLDDAPDGSWVPAGKAPKAPETPVEADSAPADEPTDPTPTN